MNDNQIEDRMKYVLEKLDEFGNENGIDIIFQNVDLSIDDNGNLLICGLDLNSLDININDELIVEDVIDSGKGITKKEFINKFIELNKNNND